MPSVVVSLPDGTVGRSITGGAIALGSYAAMQLLLALVLHRELLPESVLYPAVCVSAGLSSFMGCIYSVLKGKGSGMLTVSSVVVVFLVLTLAVGLMAGGGDLRVENGLIGIGLSMTAGGLFSAIVGDALLKKTGSRRRRPVRKRK